MFSTILAAGDIIACLLLDIFVKVDTNSHRGNVHPH